MEAVYVISNKAFKWDERPPFSTFKEVSNAAKFMRKVIIFEIPIFVDFCDLKGLSHRYASKQNGRYFDSLVSTLAILFAA